MNWFECKVRYDKEQDNGTLKTVTELYLLDALSYTEAESRIIEEMNPIGSVDFSVVDISRRKYYEVIPSENGGKFFKVKIELIVFDDRTGAEKRTSINSIVQGSEISDVLNSVTITMKNTMSDYAIHSVTRTIIQDLFLYEKSNE